MPQSNYSIALQNQQHKVKFLMRCISHFLHIPCLISRLTFYLIAHVSVPLFLFLLNLALSLSRLPFSLIAHVSVPLFLFLLNLSLSLSPAFVGLYVKTPKEKEVAWPTKGRWHSVMLLSSVTLNDSFHLTQRWPTQFPTGLAMAADILDVQQRDWLILHSVQAPRLSDPNQTDTGAHSKCLSQFLHGKEWGKNWGQLDAML